jgi:hypothetical protein
MTSSPEESHDDRVCGDEIVRNTPECLADRDCNILLFCIDAEWSAYK